MGDAGSPSGFAGTAREVVEGIDLRGQGGRVAPHPTGATERGAAPPVLRATSPRAVAAGRGGGR